MHCFKLDQAADCLGGTMVAFMQIEWVQYVPYRLRFLRERQWLAFLPLPTMKISTMWPQDPRHVVTFEGAKLLAPSLWMNHWLYMALSILDALVNSRTTYVAFQTASFYLSKKVNFANFIFACSHITRITWIMCFVQSFVRLVMKMVLRSLRGLGMLNAKWYQKLDHGVDSVALFLSYKLFSLLLFLLLGLMLVVHKNTTFMVRAKPSKRGIYGNWSDIAPFWQSEMICDFLIAFAILTVCGYSIAIYLVTCTKYQYVTTNKVIQLLQQRYVLVGWDILTAMDILGIDPQDPHLFEADHNGQRIAMTNCSYGKLLQLLYLSGPSGLVHMAGDAIFTAEDTEVVKYYPPYQAMTMGLTTQKPPISRAMVTPSSGPETTKSALEDDFFRHHRFQLYAEWRWGTILMVDDQHPGKWTTHLTTQLEEYAVQDALTYLPPNQRTRLLRNDATLQIR